MRRMDDAWTTVAFGAGWRPGMAALALALLVTARTWAAEPADRVAADAARGLPLVVHAFVPLCDNENQGIVPVPEHLGDGRDPDGNLYWGARYGLRTWFDRARGWTRTSQGSRPNAGVLQRLVFTTRARDTTVYLVADAWDGSRMREAIHAFMDAASGRTPQVIDVDGQRVEAGGRSHVVAFLGHNGLMDFEPPVLAPGEQHPARAAIVLACASRRYFQAPLARSGARPLLLTTGLMAPEAYTFDAALRAWLDTLQPSEVIAAAAAAYDRHQRCGLRAARRLFATGLD